ncbi:acetate/propionate family kinase [Frankia sp. AgB32]|uniref:acetate/propionate family kinase n=1 Tax=Frankia sp. AgB32 TaxID=631119 RepID=UPI00200C3C29|nr:acetate/propionate family kinase [Frankia sp. AgB32]MCK9893944.1 acetate/propionate family kinase [Frankia sp. AgB32]
MPEPSTAWTAPGPPAEGAGPVGGAGTRNAANILVLNAGSSSLKMRLLGPEDETLWSASRGEIHDAGADGLAAVVDEVAEFGAVAAIGHRFVHGGPRLRAPVRLDESVEAELRARTSLAPQHLPAALDLVAAVRAAAPDIPQVACFDTAFHATLSPAAATYAIPPSWRESHGIRRYGFHGLSHAYAARRAGDLLGLADPAGSSAPSRQAAPPGHSGGLDAPDPAGGPGRPRWPRVVTCHLGSGASLAAVADGICRDTTMGFTPLDGLVMGTRSGGVDPGALLWLLREAGLSADELADGLEHHSGLLGLAGSADMRDVLAAADDAAPSARLALAVYLHRLRALVAAMVAALGGLDALVFTGGIGEAAPRIRAGAAAGLEFLGLRLDPARNAAHDGGDSEIGAPDAPVRMFVVEAREDLEIARGVRAALAG